MELKKTTTNSWEIRALKGFAKFQWLWKRFWYVRFVLNWAWEPDSLDFNPNVEHWGLFQAGSLLAGVRLFFLDTLENSLQYRVSLFRSMIPLHTWRQLQAWETGIMEASRLLLFSPHRLRHRDRFEALRWLLRQIYIRGVRQQRPLVLALGNEFTFRLLKRVKVAQIKVLGQAYFPSRNGVERRLYGDKVPHYVILVNLLATAKLSREYKEYQWWHEGLNGKATLWPVDLQTHLSQWWEGL